MSQFDVTVIGGGPGGYVAAIRASQLGLKVALVEKEHLGGICLNWGCIPTKSLLKSAEVYSKVKNSEEFGVYSNDVSFNLEKIVSRSRDISSKLVGGIKGLLSKNKVTIYEGEAKIKSPTEIIVDGSKTIKTKNIIIATGARARVLDGFQPNGANIWSYKEALMPKDIPKSMVIVGSGAIGVEFASFYNAMGVDVTVLEAAERILPVEDEEISKIAKKSFEQKGIKFRTGISLQKQQSEGRLIELSYRSEGTTKTIKAEILLMAVGIEGNVENVGLENTNVVIEKGHIITDKFTKTSEENIFAIGDVAGAPWLAHKASHEGIIAAEIIAGKKAHPLNKMNIAGCTYSSPQIASVGLTQKQAEEQGYEIKIGKFPFYANAKALIVGDGDGMVKTIFDKQTGELLGAHMVGTDVTELIQGYVITRQLEGTELDLINTIFPHPTQSEMMHESALQAFNRAIHI